MPSRVRRMDGAIYRNDYYKPRRSGCRSHGAACQCAQVWRLAVVCGSKAGIRQQPRISRTSDSDDGAGESLEGRQGAGGVETARLRLLVSVCDRLDNDKARVGADSYGAGGRRSQGYGTILRYEDFHSDDGFHRRLGVCDAESVGRLRARHIAKIHDCADARTVHERHRQADADAGIRGPQLLRFRYMERGAGVLRGRRRPRQRPAQTRPRQRRGGLYIAARRAIVIRSIR